MAEPTVVGRTRVSLIPDTSKFGDLLKIELPKAIRQPARDAGDVAGDEITDKIKEKLAKFTPTVKVDISLDTASVKLELDKLTKARTVDLGFDVDDSDAKKNIDKLTSARTISIDFDVDTADAKKKIDNLVKDRTIDVTADLDISGAEFTLKKLTRDASVTVDVSPVLNDTAKKKVETALDKLCKDRVVNIRASVDTRVGAAEIRNLLQRRQVRIGVDVDTRVAADSLANLTRRRQMTVAARADTAAANTALNHLTRDRTMNVRIRASGLSALTAGLSSLGGSGGGGGLGILSNRIVMIAGAAIAALPTIASLGSAIAQMGPLAATAAPALGLLIGLFAAIKVGTSGVSDAVKAAFQPVAGEAKAAATATRQVENAQRSLARAQRSVQDAQRQSAERVAQANRQVADAERDLSRAQRDARQAQADLTAARRQATRDLEDMQRQLKSGRLSEEEATLAVQQAELDLQQTRTDPAATQLQIQQAELARDRAVQSLEDQRAELKRLETDTAAANRAGVNGSKAVVQARQQIAAADEQVTDRQRALADAQQGVTRAQAEGQRQVADAQQAVADAVRQVAEAQENAASQTSKLDDALAKLSPNARGFVATLQRMAPAWRDMKLDVQDRLFAGLGTRLEQVGARILPTVRRGLGDVAGEANLMGKTALTAVSDLEKTGTLGKVFDGIRTNLGNLRRIPGQLVTGFAQLSVAAQPAFDRMTSGAASAVDRIMGKLAKGLESGRLTEAINTALDVAVKLGGFLADIGGIFLGIFKAASAAGGDFFGVIGAAVKEIRRIIELPEVQRALTQIFTAINAVAGLIAGVLGQTIQALLPLLATLAPTIVQITQLLGPVIGQLISDLGGALAPIAAALGPVLVVTAKAIGQLVAALSPLLPVVGNLVAALLPPLVPLISTIGGLFTALAPVIRIVAGVLGAALKPILTGLTGVVVTIAQAFARQFLVVLRQLLPVIPQLVPVVVGLAQSIGQILVALAPLIPQIMLVGVMLLSQLLPALLPLVPPLAQLSLMFTQLATWVILKIVVPVLTRLITFLGGLRKAFQPAVDAVKWLTSAIAAAFDWVYDHLLGHSVIPDIVNGAISWFTSLWRRGVELFTNLKNGATKVWDSFWSRIRSTATGAWKAVRQGFDDFAKGLESAFRRARDGIGDIWDGLRALVKAPIRFWIETVYNRGIVSVWNQTAAKIPGIPDMPKMALPKGFARGGVLPGWSTWRDGDDQLVPMRRGEGVYVSEVMRDPYERARLHALNAAAIRGTHPAAARAQLGFAEGGIFGAITDAGSAIASKVGGALKKGAGAVRGGLADLAESAFKPVRSGIRRTLGGKDGTWPGAIAGGPLHLINRAIDYIRGQDIPPSSGAWMKPVNAPYGTRFGVAGRMWSSGRHTGLDFPAATGTKVVAVDNGTVQSVQSGGPYGKHVLVSHGGGLASLYAHMSAMVAKAGQGIKQGARIGSVGATGNVTGPHLHLEARINGRSVDPMGYISGGWSDAGGSGVKRWTGIVQQALGQLKQSTTLVSTTLRRMNQESGGNPRAVNRTDSNWKAGHPSVGLMQVIKGTFAAYADKYRKTGPFLYGVSVDPMANVYASMRYALARYGSLSKAYNRPGGYSLGGIIHRGRGYASGGIIRVAGRDIRTGPLAAAVGGDFLKQLTGTTSAISTAMTKVATAVKNAFKGVKTSLDDKLLKQISTANTKLQALARQRDAIKTSIAAASQLAADATGQAVQYTALTGLPNSGQPFGAGGILAGLNTRLGQLKKFGVNLKLLGQRGLNKTLLQQIITAGPEQGAAYAQALVDATPTELKNINLAQTAIASATSAFGKDAADSMYDVGVDSGKGYLTGLASTQKLIEAQMMKLAKAVQKTIEVELEIRSPARKLRRLGWFTGLGYARGVEDAVPQAASAASRMANTVRAAAAVTAARIHSQQTVNNRGDRHLHYNAAVREVAPRQSILDALAIDDLLHATTVTGG
ncbi:peptidoglycan DD-metalloendopeptidase family protein [Streptomyces sp. NPDC091281]|uniref:peptidoglycan DD-metalloendopeptidase family protein n=1 Tax=Streptomyces sp. NPDC091281 TaxID=3365985 RepID=UPI0038265722